MEKTSDLGHLWVKKIRFFFLSCVSPCWLKETLKVSEVMPITVQCSWCNNQYSLSALLKKGNSIVSLFYNLSKKIKLSWSIWYQKRPNSPLFSQYSDDLPSFHPTFSQLLLCDHVLTSWMGRREMRPTADPNGEVIVMEMWREPVKRGLCFSWRPTKTPSRENRGRGAAAKTVGILSTQDM